MAAGSYDPKCREGEGVDCGVSRRYREDEEWKGRRGRPLYEDKVEMRLGEVEERGGTAASTRQAAHERRDA